MKVLAIETELKSIEEDTKSSLLKEEVQVVLALYNKGFIKEIYFNEEHCAVIILECESIKSAKDALSKLPLVSKGYISFKVMGLNPYTGFERLAE
ncbi:MAG: hypothetical protein IH619_04395 [Ignavibacterium sp.]|nr:hypothetical protein [Ignavibacterium sp.]